LGISHQLLGSYVFCLQLMQRAIKFVQYNKMTKVTRLVNGSMSEIKIE